jgi:hypothetical protein
MSEYVYFVRGDSGLTKIGFTTNPQRRCKQFGKLLHIIKTDDGRRLESDMHRHFASVRKPGEWYSLGGDDMATVRAIDHVEYGEARGNLYINATGNGYLRLRTYDKATRKWKMIEYLGAISPKRKDAQRVDPQKLKVYETRERRNHPSREAQAAGH